MSFNLLKGKKGIIFGALNEQSIAWKVAERAVEEGAEIVLTNTPVSLRMGTLNELAAKCNAPVIAADATSVADLEHLVDEAMKHFGGPFDFALHSIGMSPNVRKGRTYDDLDYDYLQKTLDISAISFHKMIQVLRKKDALREWGSIVALSYIAAQRTLYGYNDMADAKALLESIARSFGYIYGREKHVRINTVSQSPTPTTAGNGVLGLKDLMEFAESMSPLGNASANDCADYVLTLFSDLTRKVTMQNLFHDGGFSSMGMSRRAMRTYEKGCASRTYTNISSPSARATTRRNRASASNASGAASIVEPPRRFYRPYPAISAARRSRWDSDPRYRARRSRRRACGTTGTSCCARRGGR